MATRSMARPPSALVLVAVDERADEHDPLALLARDLGPVVGVGRVGQVLVLLVLLLDGVDEVVGAHALGAAGDEPLDGQLLGPPDDVLDHGARGEVLVVEDLLVAVLVGDLEEAVLLVLAVHLVDGGGDHLVDRGERVAPAQRRHLVLGQRDLRREVPGEDLLGRPLVGPLDLDLHVEAARAQDGRVDEVLTVRGADHDDVLQALDAVDLGQQLGHDRRLHVGGDA